jgi:hypothetical protein
MHPLLITFLGSLEVLFKIDVRHKAVTIGKWPQEPRMAWSFFGWRFDISVHP